MRYGSDVGWYHPGVADWSMRAGGYRSGAMAPDAAHRYLCRAGQEGARLGRTDGDLPHHLDWPL